MSEHFKLEITNRSIRITIFSGVSENFAQEYYEMLSPRDDSDDSPIDWDNMTPELRTVFENAGRREPIPEDKKSTKHKQSAKDKKGKYSVYNYNKRIKMRAEKFRSLAYINFKIPNVHFTTLTFDPKVFECADDLAKCKEAFQLYVKRVQRKYKDFLYLGTFSTQKNGHWHFHMLQNFDVNVQNKVIQDLWQNGMTYSLPITTYTEFDQKVSYCIDNMKNVAWEHLQSEKGIVKSHHMQNALVLHSWKDSEADAANEYLSKIINSTDKPIIKRSYDLIRKGSTEKEGTVTYMVSHKTFPELFPPFKVAQAKNDCS